jgi:hypothetical protein
MFGHVRGDFSKKVVDCRPFSLGNNRDRAIRQVLYIANDMVPRRNPSGREAKAYPLNIAGVIHFGPFHVRRPTQSPKGP